MKKIILASTVALSILGYTQATVQAQENKAESVRENVTIPHSSTSKIENQEKPKEKVEKPDYSSKIDDKEEKIEKKTPATAEKKAEVKKEETKVEKVKEGWQEENNNWRFYEHNKHVTNWKKIQEKWYYATSSGKISQNKWEKINGIWYYFDKTGIMFSNKWQGNYYLKSSGAMAEKEWIFDKTYNSWFYLKENGTFANREWIGAYYLKSGGYMAKNEWIFDKYYNSWYYLKENGQYVTNIYKISGKDHIFKNDGRWVSEVPEGFVKGQYSKTIFLDPGHGGRDSGAYYYNVAEKDLNMQVYRKLRKKLEELGYKVLTSRDSDIDVDFVTERSRMVNKTNSDIFISIHFNATGSAYSKSSGIQTYSYSDESDYPSKINPYWHNHPDRMSESKRLAAAIHSSLLAETGAKDAGLLESSFAVLRETAKPAVLLELGYMDNFAENQQIRDSHYQDKLVAGIVKGIQKYYAGK